MAALITNLLVALSLSSTRQDQRPVRIPTITIGHDIDGVPVDMPLIGAGTWQYNDTIAYESVCKSFAAGYTFVDTAFGYGNQEGVGRAIKDCWHGSREDLFVMTKIPGGLSAAETLDTHAQNLDQLGLDYVDHVMTHFPADWKQTPERSSKQRRQEEWVALENLYYRGLTRSIGFSHYCPRHIDDVMEVATVQPSVNQVEYHVGSGDLDDVMDKCQKEGIYFMSFSPLCGPCQLTDPSDSLINGELVTDVARKHGVLGAQVSLRFIVQQALESGSFVGSVIPKSNNLEHILSNMDIFSFELDDKDMARLSRAKQPAGEGGDCDVA
jgi:diketogulonate reductase-like aldo/keto reductase